MLLNRFALDSYSILDDEECEQRIIKAKQILGDRLLILGHHYQRDEVFRHADFSGDSLKLSREAANSQAEYIVFCGVHFMAEVADILTRPEQTAILPDVPRLAWSMLRSVIVENPVPAVVRKPRLPSKRRLPWKVVTCEIRSMASNDESICN